MKRGAPRTRGATLVELVVSIVLISLALTGVLLAMDTSARHGADPMIQHQALAIAEAHLDEILPRPFVDPDGSEAGETRATFDDLDDYNGLDDSAAHDANGNAISGLSGYRVRVTANTGSTLNGVAAARIDVRVTHASGLADLTLTGWRTDY